MMKIHISSIVFFWNQYPRTEILFCLSKLNIDIECGDMP